MRFCIVKIDEVDFAAIRHLGIAAFGDRAAAKFSR